MFDLRPLKYLLVLSAFSISIACGDDPAQPDVDPVIALTSGNGQTAEVGQALADPLIVTVTDGGSALSGQSVAWAVTAGGGSVSPTTSTTDANGRASTVLTLGATAGTNTVTATAAGTQGSPITFNATAEDDSPAPTSATVTVADFSFTPATVTVAAGGTVTWNWAGTTSSHNVTFASGTNSATQTSGSFPRDFPTAGTFPYQCTIHGSSMSGTVIVE